MATVERRNSIENTLTEFLIEETGAPSGDARERARSFLDGVSRAGVTALGRASNYWWLLALRGVLALLAAFAFFTTPGKALVTLALVVAVWVFVDGIFSVASSISEKSWYLALSGAVGIALGWLMLTRPGSAALALFVMMAAWAIARGIAEIAFAVAMPRKTRGRASIAWVGIASCIFGVILIAAPFAGAVALAIWIGAYALAYGAFEIIVAIQLFRAHRRIEKTGGTAWQEPGLFHRERTA
jgi:uncharacterized membrane protein HdeD (DUF308 family)